MVIYFVFIFFVLFFSVGESNTPSRLYVKEELLFSGSEKIVRFGLDTTSNLWFITEPFENGQRIYVNEFKSNIYDKVRPPVFSPDGLHWGVIVERQGVPYIILDGNIIPITATTVSHIHFSNAGNRAVIVAQIGQETVLDFWQYNGRSWEKENTKSIGFDVRGNIAFSTQSSSYAYITGAQNALFVRFRSMSYGPFQNVGWLQLFQDSIPVYTVQNGSLWDVYLGESPILKGVDKIVRLSINREKTAIIIAFQRFANYYIGKLTARQFVVSDPWDALSSFVSHPSTNSYAVIAKFRNQYHFVMDGVSKRPLHEFHTMIRSGYNGRYFYCLECPQTVCHIISDGEEVPLNLSLDTTLKNFVYVNDLRLFGYTYGNNFYVYNLQTKESRMSYQYDQFSEIVYNWYRRKIEVLAIRNGQLYLLQSGIVH